VDILIPYWGDPDYAKQTLASVLAQTSDRWRLTIVDDAYPDSTFADYVAELNHPQVRYLRKDENAGITENYRTCVELAELPLTVLLGCDDRLLPTYVAQIVAAHDAFPVATIIQPGVRVIDENGDEVRTLVDQVKARVVKPGGQGYQLLGGEALAANLLTGNWLYWPSLAFRTERLKETPFRDGYPVTQDLALIMDFIFAGDQLLTFDTVCFEYRRHQNSASSVQLLDAQRFDAERDYCELAARLATDLGWRRAARAARARLTIRAHALATLPRALARRDFTTAGTLARHGFGR
jgi:glycosyltransferase involved in cell wall biosynthesis